MSSPGGLGSANSHEELLEDRMSSPHTCSLKSPAIRYKAEGRGYPRDEVPLLSNTGAVFIKAGASPCDQVPAPAGPESDRGSFGRPMSPSTHSTSVSDPQSRRTSMSELRTSSVSTEDGCKHLADDCQAESSHKSPGTWSVTGTSSVPRLSQAAEEEQQSQLDQPLFSMRDLQELQDGWGARTRQMNEIIWRLEQELVQERIKVRRAEEEKGDLQDEMLECQQQVKDTTQAMENALRSSAVVERSLLSQQLQAKDQEVRELSDELAGQKKENQLLRDMLTHEARAVTQIVKSKCKNERVLLRNHLKSKWTSCAKASICLCTGPCKGDCSGHLLMTPDGNFVL